SACGSAASCLPPSSARRSSASAWPRVAGRWARATTGCTRCWRWRRSSSSPSLSPLPLWRSCARGAPLDLLAVPQIPLVDVKAQYAPLLDEVKQRIADVLDAGVFILGPNVKAFEEEAAAYLGVPQAVGVANGTDALVLVLDALGIGPGDEVVCP